VTCQWDDDLTGNVFSNFLELIVSVYKINNSDVTIIEIKIEIAIL